MAIEWRFRIQPPGEPRRPLVPDVAYVSDERLRGLSFEEAESPAFAPDIAIEILSPDDRPGRVESKIRTYLACKTHLVIVIDPTRRSLRAIDRSGDRTIFEPASFSHAMFPGFSIDLVSLFEALALPR